MSETGHTPGPWHASPDAVPEYHVQITVHAENGDRVATVFQTEANANLIAAAPDLLAAAKGIMEYASLIVHTDDEKDSVDLAVEELRDAINKATGVDA